MSSIVATLGGAWVIVGVVTFVLFGYFVPISIFVTARNARKIARQLERLNDLLESGRSGAGPLKL